MKSIITLLFSISLLCLNAQEQFVFYKTIETKQVKDSISNHLIESYKEFVILSKPCYWESRDTFGINYCDSYLLMFQDDSSKVQLMLITEFFIYQITRSSNEAFSYFKWNGPNLLATSLRPDVRDRLKPYFDTAAAKSDGVDLSQAVSLEDSLKYSIIPIGWKNYRRGVDGLPFQYITIGLKDTSRTIAIDQYLFYPSNFYYQFNCQKSIYTLRILLLDEFESLQSNIEFNLENKSLSELEFIEPLDFKGNEEYFEKIYEEQINYWLDMVEKDLDKNWEIKKN